MSESNTVERSLRDHISRGRPGDRLPSVRALVGTHRVSPVTVNRIVARLEHEGLVVARPGDGTFIARGAERAAVDLGWQSLTLGARPQPGAALSELLAVPAAGVIQLATGYVDATLRPLDLLGRATSRASRHPDAWDKAPAEGSAELRTWFAGDIGGGIELDDVLIVSGGQAALSLLVRALTSPGDRVIVESPTYVGVIEVARAAGVTLVPVPTDADGLVPSAFAEALSTSGAKLAVLQPLFANPTGAVLAAERRAALLDAAREAGAFVVEDDFARDLGHVGEVMPPPLLHDDERGHVICVRSLTKATAPSLRIAAVAGRGAVMRRLRQARVVDDFFVSGLLQRTAYELVTSPGWSRHLQRLRAAATERMDAAVHAAEGLDATIASRPRGGLVLWLRIDDRLDDREVATAAREAGVAVTAGTPWFAGEPTGSHIRVSVAASDPAAIRVGMARLAPLLAAR